MIPHTFSIAQALLIFLVGGVLGALITFACTLKFAGKLKWGLGFNEAEQLYFNNLRSAIIEAEVLKIRLERMSVNFIAMDREVRRLRKLYAESCRLLAEAKASSEKDKVHEVDEQQLAEEQEAVRDAMREQMNRFGGDGKRAYTQ